MNGNHCAGARNRASAWRTHPAAGAFADATCVPAGRVRKGAGLLRPRLPRPGQSGRLWVC
eukprot:363622-Chlamydomonas_euryale.AAC.6